MAFDRETINDEFISVPWPYHAILAQAMASYQRLGEGSPRALVVKYANGVWRLRPADRSAGRCLFVPLQAPSRGEQTLLVLAVYKKEGDTVPRNVMKKAERRMRDWNG